MDGRGRLREADTGAEADEKQCKRIVLEALGLRGEAGRAALARAGVGGGGEGMTYREKLTKLFEVLAAPEL